MRPPLTGPILHDHRATGRSRRIRRASARPRPATRAGRRRPHVPSRPCRSDRRPLPWRPRRRVTRSTCAAGRRSPRRVREPRGSTASTGRPRQLRTASSTLRRRPSMASLSLRGMCPAASHRSWRGRSAVRAARGSVTGSRASASTSSARLTSRFALRSASRVLKTSLRALKNVSCASRNRFHSSSSTSRRARPAAFHSVIRSR